MGPLWGDAPKEGPYLVFEPSKEPFWDVLGGLATLLGGPDM